MYKVLIIFITILFFNCGQEQVGGTATDFPNAIAYEDSIEIALLGEDLSTNLAITNDWNESKEHPKLNSGEAQPPATPAAPSISTTSSVLGKSSAPIQDTLWVDLSDTIKGFASVIKFKEENAYFQYDTIYYIYDSLAKDTIEGNERFFKVITNVIHKNSDLNIYTLIEDMDQDSSITPDSSSENRAKITRYKITNAVTIKSEFISDAGPDLDFDTEQDNNIYFGMEHSYNDNFDSLTHIIYYDADDDGIIHSPSQDSSIVDVESLTKNSLARTFEDVRIVIFAHDSTANYPIKLTKERITNHTITKHRITHVSGDSLFTLGDSVITSIKEYILGTDKDTTAIKIDTVKSIITPIASDQSQTLAFYFKSDLARFKTNFDTERQRSASFTLIPDHPLPDGTPFTYGSFEWHLTRYDSTHISLTGIVTPEGRQAELSIDTNSYKVYWNSDGQVDSILVTTPKP